MKEVSLMLWKMQADVYAGAYLKKCKFTIDNLTQQVSTGLQEISSLEVDLADLNSEVIKSLHNESELSITILQGAIDHTDSKLKAAKQRLRTLEDSILDVQRRKEMFINAVDKSNELLDILHSEDSTAVKELLYCLIKRVEVYQTSDVEIEYQFSVDIGAEKI